METFNLKDGLNTIRNQKCLEIMENILMSLKTRLQPILMTSLTTAFGMLPIAIGIGENSQVLQPLGIAVSWGLWVSLIFTLYFVPWALFSLEKK